MAPLRIVAGGSSALEAELARLSRRGVTDLATVEPAVRAIIEDVLRGGDAALRLAIERFEKRRVGDLFSRNYDGEGALRRIAPEVAQALAAAATRIRAFHERQCADIRGFEQDDGGVMLASRVTPLDRVGVYVPGGKAFYPSTVLMAAIPARAAGVREVYVATPAAVDEVRAACHLAGVDGIVDAGGAQAIAALAYGTESVPRVDKIVGPGSMWVAAAKRLVFGAVGIDSIAGPTEILVLADESASAVLVAADLLSQAEHDEAAYPLLACMSEEFARGVCAAIGEQLPSLPRQAIAAASLRDHGVALVARDEDELVRVANALAAEHVAVHCREPRRVAHRIERAGAVFVGTETPEAAGDYIAGPSHVLPTGGSARYSSPLGVYDFVSRTSIIEYTPAALAAQADAITALARAEGLEAHARAVEYRLLRSQRAVR